jgi:hypothetical protein
MGKPKSTEDMDLPLISISKTRLNFRNTHIAMIVSEALNVFPGKYALVPTASIPKILSQIYEHIINSIEFEVDN